MRLGRLYCEHFGTDLQSLSSLQHSLSYKSLVLGLDFRATSSTESGVVMENLSAKTTVFLLLVEQAQF